MTYFLRLIAGGMLLIGACAPSDNHHSSSLRFVGQQNVLAHESFRELTWIGPSSDPVDVLTAPVTSCLRPEQSAQERQAIAIGEAAFSNPQILGGQAARARLSCASCHIGGGANPSFFLPGLSDAPGHADTTSSIFSAVREDGVFNPKPIPSLYQIAEEGRANHEEFEQRLVNFVVSAVEDEFQGEPLPPSVLNGLISYIRHLDANACQDREQVRKVSDDVKAVRKQLELAVDLYVDGDERAAQLMLLGAQNKLFFINERYSTDELQVLSSEVVSLSRQLGQLRDEPLTKDVIRAKIATFDELAAHLVQEEQRSFYNRVMLEAALLNTR